jgi:hypothetical protein
LPSAGVHWARRACMSVARRERRVGVDCS